MTGSQDLSGFSMLDLFRMEVETQTATMSNGLLELEQNPTAREKIEPLMRAAHSIKGAARIVQQGQAVKVAHALEDCFVASQEGKVFLGAEEIDGLLQAVDWLAKLGQGDQPGDTEADPTVDRMVENLVAIKEGKDKTASGVRRPASGEDKTADAIPEPAVEAKPPPEAKPAGAREPESADRVVRVTSENLDRLMGLAGETLVESHWLKPFAQSLLRLKRHQADLPTLLDKLGESLDNLGPAEEAREQLLQARQRAGEFRQQLAERFNELEQFDRRSSNLAGRLYREVIGIRMRPFSDGVQGFPRLVRDLARQLGKQVKLEITGKSTEVDRDILDKLEAPLNHLLRNAVDHGIELPAERRAAGKPEEGTIHLEAGHRAGMLNIILSDDGRGIDLEILRHKVVERNLVSPDMAGQLSEAELMEFLFLPGFSTAQKVTEISGRGVGLDVVRDMVQEVRGVVRAVSRPGKDMCFHLQLPLTLSVVRTVLVEISREPYAFPLARLDRLVRLPREALLTLEGRPFFAFEGQNIGLMSAHQVLEQPESPPDAPELSILVMGDRSNRYGLVVDRFLGERELVVRPLDRRLGKVPDISAAAVLPDGSPVLIVDVEDMVRSIEKLLEAGQLRRLGRAAAGTGLRKPKRILVVDDSLTVREVERQILENQGYEVEVALDGMDGWNAVRGGHFDLVITDVDMPRLNGIDLVTLIKNDPALKALPVTIVSYKDREEDRQRGLAAGANYYLTKSSFQDETFLNAVMDLIGKPWE